MKKLIILIGLVFSLLTQGQSLGVLQQLAKNQTEFAFDTDAQAYFDVVTTYSEPQKILINDFIVNTKSDGIWAKLDALYFLFAGNATDAKWNLKDLRDLDAAYRLDFVTVSGGGPTFSADGMSPNQLGYANTFIATNTLGQNDNHISYYSRTSGGIAGNDMGASNASFANALYISMRWSDDQDYSRNSASAGGRAYSNDTGFYINTRIDSGEYKLISNAGTVTTTYTSVSLTTRTIWIGAYNAPTPSYGGRVVPLASVGDGLTPTEAANFKTEVDALITGLDGLAASLIFSTGFEGLSFGTPNAFQSGYTTLSGTDSETGYTFSNTSPQLNGSLLSAFHMVNSGGATLTNEFVTVTGHTGASTTVLRQEIIDDPGVSQIPYQINNISWNGSEYDIDNQLQNIYVRQWRKLRASDLDVDYDWAVLWEYKTYHWDDSEGEGYRIISDIQRDPVDHKLYAFHRGDIGQGVSDPSGYNFFLKQT